MSLSAPICSTELLHKQFTAPPVVVVGLPRSGSSFLSRVLSRTPDLYVFDDLYIRHECLKYNNPDRLTDQDISALAERLYWTLHSRIKYSPDSIPEISYKDARRLTDSIAGSFFEKFPKWCEIQSEFLSRLALLSGVPRWGWKCPGDFRVLESINNHYPGIQVIFLHRNPIDVLLSRKHVPEQDGDRRTYHPVVQSIYWETARRHAAAFAEKHPGQILFVSFDEMISDRKSHESILSFLNARSTSTHLDSPNTSFSSKSRPLPTYIELKCANFFCRAGMRNLGYRSNGEWGCVGLGNFLMCSVNFCRYYASRCVSDRSSRKISREFLRSLLSRKKPF